MRPQATFTDAPSAGDRLPSAGTSLQAGRVKTPPLQKVSAVLLLAVMVVGLNFHLFFFQLYGWTNMVVEYRQTSESWSEAAQQTLSGETPCTVCRQVETALWPSEKPPASADEIPFQPIFFILLPSSKPVLPNPPATAETIVLPGTAPRLLASAPTAPPPRSPLA